MEEVQRQQRSESQHHEGTLEVIGGGNRTATKRWAFDRMGSFGNSKAVLRFTAPPEVKGVGLLIVNHPDRASDQWMWRPNIGREQRVALQDRSTRFLRTDFSFEDPEEPDMVKDWSSVGGYAGEAVTQTASNPLAFAPDRGFARSFVGRTGLTIDVNRSLAVETARARRRIFSTP